MKREIKCQEFTITLICAMNNYETLVNWICSYKPIPLKETGSIVVIDIDNTHEEYIPEIQKIKFVNIVCVSKNWSVEQFVFAKNIGCKAFLTYKNLTSFANILALSNHGSYIFDDTVTRFFRKT